MDTALHVALSAQIAGERRLATIADNIANSNTSGFRQVGIKFSEQLDSVSKSALSFVTPGLALMSDKQGPLDETGNQLDFAINGTGWFLVQTPAGEAITRDGRFQIDQDGGLVSLDGNPVLDQGGSPVQVNLALGPVRADAAGILHQNGAIIGSVGIFDAAAPDETLRYGSLAILPEEAAVPAADRDDYSVVQGFAEKSNVDAVEQITRLISVQRNFESVANLIQQTESSLNQAIQLLSGK
jgi:flagellar basal-body rod protein FlgF